MDRAAADGPEELAKLLAVEAIKTLRNIARNGKSEAARVSAADKILDRALGKPAQGGTKRDADNVEKVAPPVNPWDNLLDDKPRPN